MLLTEARVHDSKVFEELVEPVKGIKGRPRKRPEKLHADKVYDYPRCRKFLRKRGIKPRIARRGLDSGERLGCHRWIVERTRAWLACYRGLAARYERRADMREAFLQLGCALVCFDCLQRGLCNRLLASTRDDLSRTFVLLAAAAAILVALSSLPGWVRDRVERRGPG